jgi:hypothetical protein
VRGCSCRAAQSDGRCARARACASERLGRGVGKQTVLLTNLLPTRLYGRPLSGKRRVCVQRTVGARSRYGRDLFFFLFSMQLQRRRSVAAAKGGDGALPRSWSERMLAAAARGMLRAAAATAALCVKFQQ